jgi:two-component system, OmpR family, sensor histidine kinase KdpD
MRLPATRGRLRVYLGVAPGAGATCALLREGHRRAEQGADVVVAGVQTGGRPFTAGMLEGLEIIPPATAAFTGAAAGDMDLGAVLARAPQVALVDDLAHSNLPGRGYASRWQDVAELMAAGIDVITTVSIGHLDSLADVAENITGVPAGRTVPDSVVLAAHEIELVDVTPEALRDRIARGQVYPREHAEAALSGAFRVGPLAALRELALLWLAASLTQNRQRYRPDGHVDDGRPTRERIMVGLTGGPEGQALIRRGFAGRARRPPRRPGRRRRHRSRGPAPADRIDRRHLPATGRPRHPRRAPDLGPSRKRHPARPRQTTSLPAGGTAAQDPHQIPGHPRL